jgi:hypothetical protein
MTGGPVARRYPASAFPEIRGIRLTSPEVAATLVNLSATGVLVECASRLLPGAVRKVHFDGTFSPASIEGRVVRCEVAGIATDGSLRLHVGVAFTAPITLPNEAGDGADARAAAPTTTSPAPEAVAAPVLRNRW